MVNYQGCSSKLKSPVETQSCQTQRLCLLTVEPGVCQNMALHALQFIGELGTARNSAFLTSLTFFPLLILTHEVTCDMSTELVFVLKILIVSP